jgi:twitching motility protein PilT
MGNELPERDEAFLRLAQEQKLLNAARVFLLRQEKAFYPDKAVAEIALAKGFMTAAQASAVYQSLEEKKRLEEAEAHAAAQPPPEPAPAPPAPTEVRVETAVTPPPPPPVVEPAVEPPSATDIPVFGDAAIASFSCLDEFLGFTRQRQASDLHLSSGYPPYMRRFGRFCFLDRPPMESDEIAALVFASLNDQQRAYLDEHLNLECPLDIAGQGRYRTTVIRQRLGWDATFRVIGSRIPTIAEIGFPETVVRLADYRQGMILNTGPGGCGKTTTMAALVDYVNGARHEHIITLERPIEYTFEPKKAHVTQRQIGTHSESYQRALRAALREDPDVILMGEMRDLETTSMAITAAETGHLVFATLHTTTAARTISRILDSYPPHQQPQIRTMIAESLRGIICQQLIPRLDREGVALAPEILVVTPGVSSLIREMKTHQVASAIQTGKKLGMVRMDDSLMDLYNRKMISIEEAFLRSEDKRLFAPMMGK